MNHCSLLLRLKSRLLGFYIRLVIVSDHDNLAVLILLLVTLLTKLALLKLRLGVTAIFETDGLC